MFLQNLFTDRKSCDIISKIDKKIAEKGKKIHEKYAFGIKDCSENNIEMLSDLRAILISKRQGSDCYSDISESLIISIINKYLI